MMNRMRSNTHLGGWLSSNQNSPNLPTASTKPSNLTGLTM